MPIFGLNVDLTDFLKVEENLLSAAQKAVQTAGQALTLATHAKILELTKDKLHTRRQAYEDALSFSKVNETTWLINLDRKARWIEDGMEPHSMIEDLLKSKKAKTAKDGSKYLAVPFEHKGGSTQMTPAQQDLNATVKSFLRNYNKKNPNAKIPYGSIEKNPDGSAKLGVLHKFDIKTAPLKTGEGVGQGKGPIGAVKQGITGIPFLQGIQISQKEVMDKKTGKKSVQRNITTFRTVSTKQDGKGMWEHPGLRPVNIMDQAVDWALGECWPKIEETILRDINGEI